MAIYLVGDIQGCDAALGLLLEKIAFSPSRGHHAAQLLQIHRFADVVKRARFQGFDRILCRRFCPCAAAFHPQAWRAPVAKSGGVTTYTITVSNAGPDAANNAVVQDPAATGLSCTAVTCPSAGLTGGATCPATLTIPALQGAGLTIPALPSGGSVKLEVVCSVTATGV